MFGKKLAMATAVAVLASIFIAPLGARAADTPSVPDLKDSSDSGRSKTDNVTKNTSLSFTGTASGATKVEILVDGTKKGEALVTAGAYDVTATGFSHGVHDVTARAIDLAGNVSSASPALQITVDTAKPDTPVAPNLDSGSDSGTSSTDDYTNDTTPTFTGTAPEADSLVALVSFDALDTEVSRAAETNDDAATAGYSLTSSEVSQDLDGVNDERFAVKVTDRAGNVSALSAMLPVTIDTKAPDAPSTPDLDSASDTGSKSDDNVTRDATPTFTGTAEDGTTVTLFAGAAKVGSAPAAKANSNDVRASWSITSSPLADGIYAMTATATDKAGHTSTASGALDVTIASGTDVLSPPGSPHLDLLSDTGWNTSDDITKKTSPTLTGATDKLTDKVIIVVDGTEIGSTNVSNQSYSFTPTAPLAPGTRSIAAIAVESSGGRSAPSQPTAVQIDVLPPTPPSTPKLDAEASDSGTKGDGITNDATPTFTSESDEKSGRLRIRANDVEKGSQEDRDADGKFSVTTSTLLDGPYSIVAVLEDLAGNASEKSGTFALVVDSKVPIAPEELALDDASNTGSKEDAVTSKTAPTIVGKAETGTLVELVAKGPKEVTGSKEASSGTFAVTLSGLTPGSYEISGTTTDKAGNKSGVSKSLTVIIEEAGSLNPPDPAFTGTDPTSPGKSRTPKIKGVSRTDTTVRLYTDAACKNLAGLGTAADFEKGITVAVEANKPTTFFGIARDAEGRESACATGDKAVYTHDDIVPKTPAAPDLASASDSGSSNSDNLTNDTTPSFTGATEAASTVKVFVDGLEKGSQTQTGETYSVTVSGLDAGSHSITTKVTDAAGNESAASPALKVDIDTTAPDTEITSSPSSTTTTDDATFAFTSTEQPSSFSCSLDGGSFSTCQSPKTYSGLSDGSHTFQVRAVDAAGNADSRAASRSWNQQAGVTDGARTLTLSASKSKVVSGKAVSLTGVLSTADSSCQVGGQRVEIRALEFGSGEFEVVDTISTAGNGSFSLTVVPDASTEFVAVAAEAGDCGQAASRVTTVLVKVKVAAAASDSVVRRGSKVVISGNVMPEHAGSRAILQRKKSGKWVNVASKDLKDDSSFRFRQKASWRGKQIFRVKSLPGDEDHEWNKSKRLVIRARRSR